MRPNYVAAALLYVVGSVAGFAPSHAAVPTSATPILLKYKFTSGELLRYRSTADSTAATTAAGTTVPTTSRVTSDFTQTVKSVDPATGNATLQVQSAPPSITMAVNGKSMPVPASATASAQMNATMVISPSGKPVSMNISGAAGSQMASAGFNPSTIFSGGLGQYSAFPDHPVKVGDIWRSAIPSPQIGGTIYMKQSLIGLSKSGGHTIAEIASRYSMDMDMSPATPGTAVRVTGQETGSGQTQFDVDSGTINSMTLTMLMKMSTAMKMPAPMGSMTTHTNMTMTMHMNRVAG